MEQAVHQHAGFCGEVSGMNLPDLLQIKVMGRFTGRITVEQGEQSGHLFFRDGSLVHAQLGQSEGREAFARILGWGSGNFRSDPKISTTRQTIHETLQFLLLDALRLQDEQAAGVEQPVQTGGAEQKKGDSMKDRLAGVAGLQDVALTDRQGELLQSFGSSADTLAAQGMYLVSTAGSIADELGLGLFKGALLQGISSHLVVLEGARHYLFATAGEQAKPAQVEAEIRRALSVQR